MSLNLYDIGYIIIYNLHWLILTALTIFAVSNLVLKLSDLKLKNTPATSFKPFDIQMKKNGNVYLRSESDSVGNLLYS